METAGSDSRADPPFMLPRCRDRHDCAAQGGLDLGSVSIRVSGEPDLARPIGLHEPVELISLRKPRGVAILHATIALATLRAPGLRASGFAPHASRLTPHASRL